MFKAYKKGEENAESYVNVFLRSIRAMCIYAENEDYMTQQENSTLRVKWMKRAKENS
ncbi:hypothetical protein RV10_GL004929 [Enterococcus pallens]|nr:hypothetical protein RV10_GL004929 [Enterococcus pallens]